LTKVEHLSTRNVGTVRQNALIQLSVGTVSQITALTDIVPHSHVTSIVHSIITGSNHACASRSGGESEAFFEISYNPDTEFIGIGEPVVAGKLALPTRTQCARFASTAIQSQGQSVFLTSALPKDVRQGLSNERGTNVQATRALDRQVVVGGNYQSAGDH
jgi:hypothetical protein